MKQFKLSWPGGNSWVVDREGCETIDEMVAALFGAHDPRKEFGLVVTEYQPGGETHATLEKVTPQGIGGGEAGPTTPEAGPEVGEEADGLRGEGEGEV